MRGDAGIFGRLVIPASKRDAWLAAELDWKSVEGHQVLKGYIGGETVADIVEGVGFVEPSEFLELSWSGDELRLLSFQSAAGFNESMVGFAAAWAAAARFGGRGELCGLGMVGTAFGYRITVAEREVAVVELPDDRLAELAALPDAAALRERMAALGGPLAAKLNAPPPTPRPKRATPALAAEPEPKKAAKPATPKKASAKKASAKKASAKQADD
jgi:hypothetical protein